MSNEMMTAAQASLQKQSEGSKLPITKQTTLTVVKHFLDSDVIKQRFNDVLKDNAPAFISSIVSLVSSSTNFDNVDPNTIIQSAFIAASLKLPINPQLGLAHIIPYGGKATFQIGWRGYKQMAIRSGFYHLINSTDVREGELKLYNRFTGEAQFNFIEDDKAREKLPIIGYVSYFKLLTGFESTFYRPMNWLMNHAKKYSKLYQVDLRKGSKLSKWSVPEELPAMCLKTVTKLNLANNGVLSIEMQQAIQADQSVPKETPQGMEYEYVDNPETTEAEIIDTNTGEISSFNPEEMMTTAYWLKQIEGCPNSEWAKFKKDHKNDLDMFTGDDAEIVKRAELEKDSAVKSASKKA